MSTVALHIHVKFPLVNGINTSKRILRYPRVAEVTEALPAVQKIPNWFQQLAVFILRDVKSKLSNRQYVTLNTILTPLLALFIGYFVKYYDYLDVENPPVYVF